MATPIKETPVLKGAQASKFLSDVKSNENNKVSQSAFEKMKNDHAKIASLIKN